MPSVILIDDETGARRGLELLLMEHDDVKIIGEADSVSSARDILQKVTPDLIFLDVEMPKTRGFDLFDHLPPQVKVIMVTAHTQYAMDAFDHEALDYLLKPVLPERLRESLDRYRRVAALHSLSTLDGSLAVKSQAGMRLLPYRKISALIADGDYSTVVMDGETDCFATKRIGYYEKELPSSSFVRLNRSLIVNLEQIVSLDVCSRDSAELKIKGASEPLLLSRSSIQKLRLSMK